MATQTVAIRAGARVTASRARSVVLSVGVGLGIGSLPWNRSDVRRQKVPWLPPANVKFLNPDGTVSRTWYQALHELFENRMGGVQGQTVVQIATTVTQTQAQVVATANYVDEGVQYTRAVAAQAAAVTQVAQNNSLAGANTIPPTPDPPQRESTSNRALD
jgi:hypothetical protein